MSDDYLWDGSGEPDPEIARLEKTLAGFRHRGEPPPFVAPEPRRRGWAWSWPRLATAAALLVIAAGVWMFNIRPGGATWNVTVLEGRPKIGWFHPDHAGKLAVGQWLQTDSTSRAEIEIGSEGVVEVGPNSRLQLVAAQRNDHRLQLRRGLIHARIWAPPGLVTVDTPWASAIDLGCMYTLQVADDGSGLLRVESGWVAFSYDGRESFVPAGASAQTRPRLGPGTPYFDDADPRIPETLTRLDFETMSDDARDAALDAVLAAARPRDGLTLWHLLQRARPRERERVFERLAQLVPPGPSITREGVLRGDHKMFEAWWDQLDLQPLSWWRKWERSWPAEKSR